MSKGRDPPEPEGSPEMHLGGGGSAGEGGLASGSPTADPCLSAAAVSSSYEILRSKGSLKRNLETPGDVRFPHFTSEETEAQGRGRLRVTQSAAVESKFRELNIQTLATKTTSRNALPRTDTGDPSGRHDTDTLAHPRKGSAITHQSRGEDGSQQCLMKRVSQWNSTRNKMKSLSGEG